MIWFSRDSKIAIRKAVKMAALVAVIAAMTLAVAGLYLRANQPAGRSHLHALVFDLGAGMGAIGEHGSSRLDEAREVQKDICSMPRRA